MTRPDLSCPACGTVLGTAGAPTTVDQVQRAVDALPAKDRAMLRPWILARYDVRGDVERAVRDRRRD